MASEPGKTNLTGRTSARRCPTLPDAVAGDITSALPYRTMTSIMNFMLAVDEAIPGFAAGETLLCAPEEGA